MLCLQETKCPDAQFPLGEFAKLGYKHVAINGQKGYHGVAIVSRHRFADRATGATFAPRAIRATSRVTLRRRGARAAKCIISMCPPAATNPIPTINDKFAHKLAFVDEMAAWFGDERSAAGRAMLVGDLNIAPLEHDVWSHKALLERRQPHADRGGEARPRPGRRALDRRDAQVTCPQQKLYTWWSYRAPDWAKADKGRRLDHVWVSPALADAVESDAGAARGPRLGAPLRPRAGEGGADARGEPLPPRRRDGRHDPGQTPRARPDAAFGVPAAGLKARWPGPAPRRPRRSASASPRG